MVDPAAPVVTSGRRDWHPQNRYRNPQRALHLIYWLGTTLGMTKHRSNKFCINQNLACFLQTKALSNGAKRSSSTVLLGISLPLTETVAIAKPSSRSMPSEHTTRKSQAEQQALCCMRTTATDSTPPLPVNSTQPRTVCTELRHRNANVTPASREAFVFVRRTTKIPSYRSIRPKQIC